MSNTIGNEYHLGVYWGIRQETLEQCTEKCYEFLTKFVEIYPYEFFPFWDVSTSNKVRDSFDKNFVRDSLQRGRNYDESDHPVVIPDLGFSIQWYSRIKRLGISGMYGSYCERIVNNALIDIPKYSEYTEAFYNESFLREVFELMIDIWKPDFGRIQNWDLAEKTGQVEESIELDADASIEDMLAIEDGKERQPQLPVGWLTYLSSKYGSLPSLPDWASVSHIENRGSIVSSGEHIACAGVEDDVRRVRALFEILNPFYVNALKSIDPT